MATVFGNIGDPEAVAAMAGAIAAELGDVDILVNCAGGDIGAAGGKPDPNNALDIALEDIQAEMQNNLIGTMLVTQAFVRPMRDRRSGCVVNIASAAAHFGTPREVVYSTLKAAVVHYTRCLAAELREYGVRVNAVSPGASKTARFQATRVTDPEKMRVDVVSGPLRRARRDRRRGGVPGRPAGPLHQRPSPPRGRRPDAVSRLMSE